MNRMIPTLGLCLIVSIFTLANAAFAGEAEIKAGMKARLSKVTALKDAGKVGEGAAGLLHARGGLNADGTKLLAAENADRQAYFSLKGKQKGIPPAEVGKLMAKGFLARAKPGHWFRDAKGNWRQK